MHQFENHLKALEGELDNYNQKIVSVDILRAQHDAIVEDLRKNLEHDTRIRDESRAVLLAQNRNLSSNAEERCQQLTADSNGLRSNLTALDKQHKQLKVEFGEMREKLFSKEREIVEKDQILGEYKLRLRQFGSENHENTQIQLADKQKTTSEAIGMADVTAKMILLEQKAQNAEAKLDAKVQELQIRGKTISRLEEKLRNVFILMVSMFCNADRLCHPNLSTSSIKFKTNSYHLVLNRNGLVYFNLTFKSARNHKYFLFL